MIRTIRRAFSTRVECDCGFAQTASTEPQADVIVRQHVCLPATPRNRGNRTSTSNRR